MSTPIGASEIKGLSDQGATFVDLRGPDERASLNNEVPGHINAVFSRESMSLPQSELSKLPSDKEADIVLYCQSGARAGKAQEQLKGLGFTNLYNAGGAAGVRAALGMPATN
mmetsp:Transcript_257/g.843  ORF Transcript_257/g.843 Transcript_257/m.843 type:complete len:112 (-) Transcript_257:185-520(-)